MRPTPQTPHLPLRRLLAAIVAIGLLVASCSGGDDAATTDEPTSSTSTTTTTTTTTSTTTAPETSAAEDTTAEDTGGDATAAEPLLVTIERSRFGPKTLTAAPGQEIVFENLDSFAHTVTSTGDSPTEFDSGRMEENDTFTISFDEPGTYTYFCELHPTMRAEVVVR